MRFGEHAQTDVAAPEDGHAPSKWSKIAKNFTVSLPPVKEGWGGMVGFGWIWLDWVGLGWTMLDPPAPKALRRAGDWGVGSPPLQGATVLQRLARLCEMAIQGATQGATKCYTRCYIFKKARHKSVDKK